MGINIFLIVVLIVLAVCTIVGYYRGLIKTIFSMAAMLVILILTVILSPYVKTYIRENTKLYDKVYSQVEEKFQLEDKQETGIPDGGENIPEYVKQLGFPEKMNEKLIDKTILPGNIVEKTITSAKDTIRKAIYDQVTEMILSAIAYIFTFAVVGVIIMVAGLLLNVVDKLPVIKQMNRVLGLIIGFLQGYLIISLLYVLATAFGATSLGAGVLEMVSESPILSFIYNNNIIVNFIMMIF